MKKDEIRNEAVTRIADVLMCMNSKTIESYWKKYTEHTHFDENEPYSIRTLAEYIFDSDKCFDDKSIRCVLADYYSTYDVCISYPNGTWLASLEDSSADDYDDVFDLTVEKMQSILQNGFASDDISVKIMQYYHGVCIGEPKDITDEVMTEAEN